MPRTSFRQPLPQAVLDRTAGLGAFIRLARIHRRWSQALLAEKAGISIMTLRSAERGSPAITLGTWVALLWAMGLDDLLVPLTDAASDREGIALTKPTQGQRVRARRILDDDF